MKWFILCLRNYVNFSGRARRKEYWFFVLFTFIFSIVARLLDLLIFGPSGMLISGLFGLAMLLPQLAVLVRRLHDTNRSGKWVLGYYLLTILWTGILIVWGMKYFVAAMQGTAGMPVGFSIFAIVGVLAILAYSIVLLVWSCLPGTKGENRYGADPKAGEMA